MEQVTLHWSGQQRTENRAAYHLVAVLDVSVLVILNCNQSPFSTPGLGRGSGTKQLIKV